MCSGSVALSLAVVRILALIDRCHVVNETVAPSPG